MKNRIIRINQLIKKRVSDILLKEVFIDGSLVTVQSVDTVKDLKYAKIRVSVMPFSESGKAIKILGNQTPNIQKILNSNLKMKFVPKIRFEIDRSEEIADRVDKLLKKIKEN